MYKVVELAEDGISITTVLATFEYCFDAVSFARQCQRDSVDIIHETSPLWNKFVTWTR